MGDTEFEDFDGPVNKMNVLSDGLGEVNEQVGTLCRGELEGGQYDRCGEEALIGSYLVEGLPIGERQGEEAAVGGVEHSKAVDPRLDFEVGPDFAIEEDAASAELRYPWVFGVA